MSTSTSDSQLPVQIVLLRLSISRCAHSEGLCCTAVDRRSRRRGWGEPPQWCNNVLCLCVCLCVCVCVLSTDQQEGFWGRCALLNWSQPQSSRETPFCFHLHHLLFSLDSPSTTHSLTRNLHLYWYQVEYLAIHILWKQDVNDRKQAMAHRK